MKDLFRYGIYNWLQFLDEWYMFDDENVTPVTSEDILKLSGGGKWGN